MSIEKYPMVKQEAFFVQGPISFQIGVAKNLEWCKYYVTLNAAISTTTNTGIVR